MMESLIKRQKQLLNAFYEALDPKALERVFDTLKRCDGVIFVTGVGKSGFIAQKITATLMSVGIKSFFLSPTDAMHGDLGMVDQNDHLVILSKSGESDELLTLLPCVRNKGVSILALTSNLQSRLAKGVDLAAHLPCKEELSLFDLAPTTSTEIQLLAGDLLCTALMHHKGLSKEEFAKNHPGGMLGKRLTLKVDDLMLRAERAPLCQPEQRLEEVIVDFSSKRCGCLVVVDKNKRLLGIFTDGDLRRSLQEKGEKVLQERLEDLMSPAPRSILQEQLASEAIDAMESDQKHPVTVLPVVDCHSQVVGLLKMHDLLQAGLR